MNLDTGNAFHHFIQGFSRNPKNILASRKTFVPNPDFVPYLDLRKKVDSVPVDMQTDFVPVVHESQKLPNHHAGLILPLAALTIYNLAFLAIGTGSYLGLKLVLEQSDYDRQMDHDRSSCGSAKIHPTVATFEKGPRSAQEC
jgi:hypothetical protein